MHICNLPIKLSKFPKNCELSKLKRMYKKSTKSDHENFRPISPLPVITKIIAEVIHDQAMDDITQNNILCRY